MSKTLMIVDDSRIVHAKMKQLLEGSDFEIIGFCRTGEDAIQSYRAYRPDLVTMDIVMPGMDGLEILRRLREGRDTSGSPVIMLTARSAEMDRVSGLENGADDYVVKPFGIMELQARVKAVLRRTERRGDQVLTCGDLEIDPAAREVHKGGRLVELTFKEFELLRLLCARRGVALTRDEILQTVWDYDYTGETRTVDMHVKALRQKLGDDVIATVRGVGYKLN